MPYLKRNSLLAGSIGIVAVFLAVAGGVVWSGIYDIGADDAHTKPVYAMLELVRDRSITARARSLHPPPNLADPSRIRQGAGNYHAMCVGCHLAPGIEATELAKGLYPSPPDLSRADASDPSHHFWVIKHGIKASGMPAWGKSMDDRYIWNLVAFLQVLPHLDAGQYTAVVASSGGHSHGGGETMTHGDGEAMPVVESKPHEHPGGTAPHREFDTGSQSKPADTPADPRRSPVSATDTVEHIHADGTVESHPAPRSPPPTEGHDHQH